MGLYVAQSEPAREAVGHHRHYMVRSRQVSRGGRGLQNWQPEHRLKKTQKVISFLLKERNRSLHPAERFTTVKKLSRYSAPFFLFIALINIFFLNASPHAAVCLGPWTQRVSMSLKITAQPLFPPNPHLLYPAAAALMFLQSNIIVVEFRPGIEDFHIVRIKGV